jgi:hypothetical protein
MKKLFILLVFTIMLSSCDNNVMVEKDNETVTTVKILNNIDTTLQVAILNSTEIYVTKDNLVIAKGTNNDMTALLVGLIMGAITALIAALTIKYDF